MEAALAVLIEHRDCILKGLRRAGYRSARAWEVATRRATRLVAAGDLARMLAADLDHEPPFVAENTGFTDLDFETVAVRSDVVLVAFDRYPGPRNPVYESASARPVRAHTATWRDALLVLGPSESIRAAVTDHVLSVSELGDGELTDLQAVLEALWHAEQAAPAPCKRRCERCTRVMQRCPAQSTTFLEGLGYDSV